MDGEVIRDPERHWEVPWPILGYAAAGVVIGLGLSWLAGRTSGAVRVVLIVFAALALLYAAYCVALSLGWVALMEFLGLGSRRGVRRAAAAGRRRVELRVPHAGELDQDSASWDWRSDVCGELEDSTGRIEVVGMESSARLTQITVEGPDAGVLIQRVRDVVRGYPAPGDAYIWVPEPAGDGTGRRFALCLR